jgi:hypothetical protein
MVQFAIRCLPRVPVATEDLEHWLEHEVEDIRREVPQGTIRLSRLTQELPTVDIGIGWLIELELPDDQPLLHWDRLWSVLRDLRLLGLQPTLLAPPGLSGLPSATRLRAWECGGPSPGDESQMEKALVDFDGSDGAKDAR